MPIFTKLNSKSQSYEAGGGTFGSVTSSDVAAATIALDPLQTALLHVCCLKQEAHGYVRWLQDQIENELVGRHRLSHGDAVKLSPVMIQDLCYGHRKRLDRDMATGYSDQAVSELLKVSLPTYKKRWRDSYKGVISYYEAIINQLNKTICKKLEGELD